CTTGTRVFRHTRGSPPFPARVNQVSATSIHRENNSYVARFGRTQEGFSLRGGTACESRSRGQGTPKRHGDRSFISHRRSGRARCAVSRCPNRDGWHTLVSGRAVEKTRR